jgi:hypothetical protein
VIALIVGICCLFFGGFSYISEIRAKNRLKWLDVEQREIEIDTYRATNEATQKRIAINPPIVESLPPNLLPSPSMNMLNQQTTTPSNIVYYKDIKSSIQPGKTLIGIRPNNTLRIGTFEEAFKILLVLGMSSSGKTTTIVEKIANAVRGRCKIIINDPHGRKPDSLLNRIYPLKPALWPNTVFAIEHDDIVKNVRIAAKELNKRVKGGDCSIPVILVVEEWNRLMRDKDIAKELKYVAETLGQEGRNFNVYAIFVCQQITGNADLRKSVISAIVHRCDKSESELIIPAKYAKFSLELKTGYTFVRDADGLTEPLQQVYITLQDVQEIANEVFPNISFNQEPLVRVLDVNQYKQPSKQPTIQSPYQYLLNPDIDVWSRQNTYELQFNDASVSTPNTTEEMPDEYVIEKINEILETVNEQPTDPIPTIITEESPIISMEQRLMNYIDKAKKDKKYI